MNFELTNDEFETLKDIFNDHGSDCPYTDSAKLQALGEKIGILEPIPEPTEEELKRREEFAKRMRPILEASNYLLEGVIKDLIKPNILYGEMKLPIGTTLRIKLPNGYVTKD